MTVTSSTQNDRIATIAACSTLGMLRSERDRAPVFSTREWNVVAQWLYQRQMSPADLLESSAAALESLNPNLALKLIDLRDRAGLTALELEDLGNRGIWALTRPDEAYPRQWKARLKGLAPPVIFGVGSNRLLNEPAIAIVGSREIDEGLQAIANAIGRRAAQAGFVVVSGGAKGSDRVGMTGAVEYGGASVGILSGELDRLSVKSETRGYVEEGQVCLVAQVHPRAGFTVGNAMARNKLIYGLADLTIVISTSEGTGGTWAGAKENLKHHWSPLVVWTGESAPAANRKLVAEGAGQLDKIPEDGHDMAELVEQSAAAFAQFSPGPQQRELPLSG